MKDKLKKYPVLWSIVILPVAIMLYTLIARTPTATGESSGTGGVAAVTGPELRGFLQSVRAGNFAAMRDSGEKLFTAGRAVPGAKTELAGFTTSSYPPNTVYALYIDNQPDRTRRVLLTLDGTDRVASFLAEEMVVE